MAVADAKPSNVAHEEELIGKMEDRVYVCMQMRICK